MASESPASVTKEQSASESKKTAVAAPKKAPRVAKSVRSIHKGQAHIQATYNNTLVSLTDMNGNVLSWSSSGMMGFKGSKKSTPYAASMVVEDAVNKVRETGLAQVDVFVRGIGSGRESAVRAIQANGLEVLSIRDVTPAPHNGCRPRKARRV